MQKLIIIFYSVLILSGRTIYEKAFSLASKFCWLRCRCLIHARAPKLHFIMHH